MTKTEKEVRDVLLGRTYLTEDGHLSSMGPDDYRMPVGISDGAMAVRFLGVAHRAITIKSSLNKRRTLEAAQDAMKHTGRKLTLVEQPDAICCLIRYVLTPPCVLTFTNMDGTYVLTGWTGRAFLGFVSRLRAMRTFIRHLPSTLNVTEDRPPEEEKIETRKEIKARLKKEKKEARRAEKAARAEEIARALRGETDIPAAGNASDNFEAEDEAETAADDAAENTADAQKEGES